MAVRLAAADAGVRAARCCSRTFPPSRTSGTASSRRRAARARPCSSAPTTTGSWSTTRSSGGRCPTTSGTPRGTIPLSIVLALADGAVGERPAARPRLPAPRVLHADRAADDRGGEHLALLLHAGVRAARAGARQARRDSSHNWLGSAVDRARRADGRDGVEGSRLLHDLLPGGAAVDVAAPGARRRRSKARRAGTSSAA